MVEPLQVRCPECDLILYVERSTGRVVETRRAEHEDLNEEDRFDALVRKAQSRDEAMMEKFNQARARQENKFERLDALFKESKSRVEKDGDIGPEVRDVDL